jgi:hypothetical protein
MFGLGIALLILGVILWLTVLPVLGWTLMVIGAIVAVAGLLLGAVWGFARGTRRRGPVY